MSEPTGANPGGRLVYLGLGSNVGDRLENLHTALALLGRDGTVAGVSSLYETSPVGVLDQPDFLNAVCAYRTQAPLPELLRTVKAIEWDAGRRPGLRWGPRPLDIDILLAGAETLATPELSVPHERLRVRAFVLVPLAELAGGVIEPDSGRTIAQLLGALPAAERNDVRLIAGPEWAIPS